MFAEGLAHDRLKIHADNDLPQIVRAQIRRQVLAVDDRLRNGGATGDSGLRDGRPEADTDAEMTVQTISPGHVDEHGSTDVLSGCEPSSLAETVKRATGTEAQEPQLPRGIQIHEDAIPQRR